MVTGNRNASSPGHAPHGTRGNGRSPGSIEPTRSGAEQEENMSDVVVTPVKDGPNHVKGKVRLVTPGGKVITYEGDEAWLCRCGASSNKPFCDGSHKRIGFKSDLDAK
jgi:CDGSH-type Zn-finger protein